MTFRTLFITSAAALTLAACGGDTNTAEIEPAETPPVEADAASETLHPLLADVAAANYSLEKTHAFMTVAVGHGGGISQYRISFTDFDADLAFDPADPEASSITFTINPLALETNYPGDYKAGHADSGFETWNEDVSRNARWLNADAFPQITFASTSATKASDLSGTVTGDLTLLGVTKPVTLDVTYNGVANPPWFGERDVIGFDASTTVLRSDFGMSAGIPAIGDEVTVTFSGEFLQDEG
ncbi:MAG: YceI family protein [Pseudomonadota bacterium]